MPFGKHAGEDIVDVPTSYLEWFLENIDDHYDLDHYDLMSEIEDELASREEFTGGADGGYS
jgi:uncharacterized protein (DUF3820 family)